jgi:hypothetical protein
MKTPISRARNPPFGLSVREPRDRTRSPILRLYLLKPALPLLLAIAVTAGMGCLPGPASGTPVPGAPGTLAEEREAGSPQQEIEPLRPETHERTNT